MGTAGVMGHEFDEEKMNTKKIKISDAIEDVDSGRKKGIAGKGKKKKKGGRYAGKDKSPDADNMLHVNNVERVDSWDSSRGQARVHDVSGRVNETPSGMNVRKKKSNLPDLSVSKEYYNTAGLSQNASA